MLSCALYVVSCALFYFLFNCDLCFVFCCAFCCALLCFVRFFFICFIMYSVFCWVLSFVFCCVLSFNPAAADMYGLYWAITFIFYTGCLKKLFPLCFLSISQLPIGQGIKSYSLLKTPLNGLFKNIQKFNSRSKIHW